MDIWISQSDTALKSGGTAWHDKGTLHKKKCKIQQLQKKLQAYNGVVQP